MKKDGYGVILNVYPDSLSENVDGLKTVLSKNELKSVFSVVYMLPSIFNSDLDRGFSIIDYSLNELYASKEDIDAIAQKGIQFKFDLVLNHLSVLSPQFQDILKKGETSKFKDFFINWNLFWQGNGKTDENGVIIPNPELIKDMFFRKPGLPVLNVRYPDGQEAVYWNTFYQSVQYPPLNIQDIMMELNMQYTSAKALVQIIEEAMEKGQKPKDIDFLVFDKQRDEIIDYLESKRQYLGQMDLNIKSDLVWDFYRDTLAKLASYGAKIVRLDAFAYASKEVGSKNFFNLPDTWDNLERVKQIAQHYEIQLLPEIHTQYEEKLHEEICERGYMTYDFFLPGLIIDAFERQTNEAILRWMDDIQSKNLKTVNMLGCHDGIPLLDLKGLLTEKQIQSLINVVVKRGGYVKDLHGKKNMYYQVNATYYSALGEDDKKMLLARAIQIFMPGVPQVWYLDLFAGKNDYEAIKRAGAGGHKEINRTNLMQNDIERGLKKDVVKRQIELLRFRNTYKAFGFDSKLTVHPVNEAYKIDITWENDGYTANLKANLKDYSYQISYKDEHGCSGKLSEI